MPQGLPLDMYKEMYPRLVAELIINSGFSRFFSSLLFILPAFLFFANLSACTVKRLLRELKRKSGRHHGPDVLHIGLMLLVIASILSFAGHRRGSMSLYKGNGVNLPDGGSLILDDFRFIRYDDGRPKDWVSVVSIAKDGVVVKDGYEIRVNKPLRYGGLTFYQTSYIETQELELLDPSGVRVSLVKGEARSIGARSYLLLAADGGRATVRIIDGEDDSLLRVVPGDMAGPMRVIGLTINMASVLEAVTDPAYPLVLASLILIALGTSWTFAQKIKEGV